MRLIKRSALTALALVAVATTGQANAQGLRGIRAEAQVGYSQFHADGLKDSHIGYGAAGGVDFDLGGFIVGGEGTFWWAPAEVEGIDGAGTVQHKTFEEYGLALRAGVMASPSTLVYGKVGLVRNEQRKYFVPFPGVSGGNAVQAPGYYENYKVNGWQWGAGVEQMLTNNVYAKVEGRYSDYKKKSSVPTGGSHTITGLIGLGVLFGAPVVEPVIAAPVVVDTPPPPAPATQTCPDGSVILATDVCPAPPPPPPPPAPAPERG